MRDFKKAVRLPITKRKVLGYLMTKYPDVKWKGLTEGGKHRKRSIVTKAKNKDRRGKRYWKDSSTTRQFFMQLAEGKGFNPFVAENWQSVTQEDIVENKVCLSLLSTSRTHLICFLFSFLQGSGLLAVYKGNYHNALKEAFPELAFSFQGGELVNLVTPVTDVIISEKPRRSWLNAKKLRAFFDALASDRGFDPLIPENWYTVTLDQVLQRKVTFLCPSSFHSLDVAGKRRVFLTNAFHSFREDTHYANRTEDSGKLW